MTLPETQAPSAPGAAAHALKNPWKSLHYYMEQDRDIFFGRTAETEEVVRLVQRDQLTVVFGLSGLGKTSLLRAGVIPRLREEGFLPVIKRVVYSLSESAPTRQIRDELFRSAAAAAVDVEETGSQAGTKQQREETLWELFHRYRFWGPRNDLLIPVLILDQFEEVFTSGRLSPHTDEFLAQLGDLVENRMPVGIRESTEQSGERLSFDIRAQNYRTILSLREDFVPKLDSLRPTIPSVMRNRFALAPLSREQGVEVVCRAGGDRVSEGVARQIVAAVAGERAAVEQQEAVSAQRQQGIAAPGAEIEPAYLSVMCYELFERMKETGATKINADLVSAERGNILDAMYERSFHGVDSKTRIFVEDRLVTPTGYRGTVPLAEAERENVPDADLQKLVDGRILRYEERFGTTHIELSHDLLTGIVKKNRDARESAARLEAERRCVEELRTQSRRRRVNALSATSALLLVAAMLLYWLGWVKAHHSYSTNFTNRGGVIYPVGAVSRSVAAHRSWTLRFVRSGRFGKVQSMEVVDSNYQLTPSHPMVTYFGEFDAQGLQEKPSRYDLVYDRNGEVVYEVALDRFGRKTWTFVRVPDKTHSRGFFLDSEGYSRPRGGIRAELLDITYDKRGFEAERFYKDRRSNAVPGPYDVYGHRMSYDDMGRMVRQTSLDASGKPMIDAEGKAAVELSYDADSNVIEQKAFDTAGGPTLVNSGWHAVRLVYDRWGREVERRFYGFSGEAVVDTVQHKAHRVTYDYDKRGNKTSIKLFTVTGKEVLNPTVKPVVAKAVFFHFAAHEQRATYDSQNRLQAVTYFDEEGKPITGPESWHGQRYEYDKDGFESAVSTFDQAGAPVMTKEGVSSTERVNDRFGRAVEERFFDNAGRTIANAEGYHLRLNTYDSAGNRIREQYLDAQRRPVSDRTNGVHRIDSTFDLFRNLRSMQFFDETQKPVNSRERFNRVEYRYDEYEYPTETRWFDKDGKPCAGPEGVHCLKKSYDPRFGLVSVEARHDANNNPAVGYDGIHEIIYEYNDKRQETKREYFGLDRKPAENLYGSHLIETRFDERGREIRQTQLRADGSPNMDTELGIATRTWAYDRENRWIENAYYDADNRLVTGPYGYAKASIQYRPYGGQESFNYGPSGKVIFNRVLGFAMMKQGSAPGGSRLSYYGPDGKLMTGPQGFAEMRVVTDSKGKQLQVSWFGPNGNPVSGPYGYHLFKSAVDSSTAARYFDTENRQIRSLGLDTVVPVIYLQILDTKQPAGRQGVHTGDIFWRFGDWSYAAALAAERAKGTGAAAKVS